MLCLVDIRKDPSDKPIANLFDDITATLSKKGRLKE